MFTTIITDNQWMVRVSQAVFVLQLLLKSKFSMRKHE